jgi:sugar lactone lactonase YvrE
MTTLNENTGAVLIADSLAGRVYRLNIKTGAYEVVLEHESMKASGAIGLNGIRTVTLGDQTFLYYSNSKTTTVNRVAIDNITGFAKGDYATLARGFYADDLAYDHKTGNVWVAGNANNTIFRINSEGEEEEAIVNASSSPSVLNPSSLMFGKGRHSRTLYGTTYAGMTPSGTVTGGNLLAVEVGLDG